MQDRNNTVLVTGAAGFIGQHLCRHLCNSGFKVRSLLHNPEQKEVFEPELELEHFTGDLLDTASLDDACENTDVLVHLGGVAQVNNLAEEKLQEINVEGTRNILQVAVKKNIQRIVLMSSSLALAAEIGQGDITAYGSSKYDAERLVQEAHKRGEIEVVVLRLVNVYGSGMKGNIARMISLIGKGHLPPLPKVDTLISLVGVEDLAQAALLSITSNEAKGQTYYVTDGLSYSITEIEQAIYRAWGRKLPAWQTPRMLLYGSAAMAGGMSRLFALIGAKRRAPGGISRRTYQNLVKDNLFNNERLCKELGFKPVCNFYESLPHIVDSLDRQVWIKGSE